MTTHAQDEFDPTVYPRTYGFSVAGKWVVSLLGLVLVALNVAGAIAFSPGQAGAQPGSALLFVLCGGVVLLGIYLLATAHFYGVILKADSIEVFEIYRRRELARGDIEGRCHLANGRGLSGWVLVPKPGLGGKIQLSQFLKTDKDFLRWIRSLPDLDLKRKGAADRERAAAIASLKKRGFAEPTIQRLRRLSVGLNFAVYGLGLASFLMRDPYHLLIWAMVAMPWVAVSLVAYFAPYYRFGGPRNSRQPDLSLLLIIPGFFLMLHALQGITPVGWVGPLLLTVFGSILLVGAAYRLDPWLKNHRGAAALLLTLCCGYGYGAGVQVNALLDQSSSRSFPAVVTSKNVRRGKSTSYHLQLAPWGPKVDGQDLRVPYSQYAAIKPGDTVCMLLRSGALGVAWAELGRCDAADISQ